MEMEVKSRGWIGARGTWKQYAFQMINSNLQYFSKIDKVKHSDKLQNNIGVYSKFPWIL